MIGSTRALRVWAYAAPADLRKGFDGLAGLVTAQLRQDPLGGDCFLFVNRTRTRAKVLLWDGTGLCVYHKRLEQGRFAALWPAEARARDIGRTLTLSELTLFLEGCTLLGRTPLAPTAVTPQTWTPRPAAP
jgi:transposase